MTIRMITLKSGLSALTVSCRQLLSATGSVSTEIEVLPVSPTIVTPLSLVTTLYIEGITKRSRRVPVICKRQIVST